MDQRSSVRRLSRQDTRRRLLHLGIERSRADAFAFIDDQDQLAYDWHTHSRHQLLYSLEGAAWLEAREATLVLPPQRAAFIPAGLPHVTILRGVRIASVFLRPRLLPLPFRQIRVVEATPLLREMVVHAVRWPPERAADDRTAKAFFRAFGMLCAEWLSAEVPAHLPRGRSRQTAAAIAYLRGDLAGATLPAAAAAARASSRTLTRQLRAELGTTFSELLRQARLIRAMELLADPEQRVTDVALSVGYQSLSTFAKSFARFTGETPRAYRRRIMSARLPRATLQFSGTPSHDVSQ